VPPGMEKHRPSTAAERLREKTAAVNRSVPSKFAATHDRDVPASHDAAPGTTRRRTDQHGKSTRGQFSGETARDLAAEIETLRQDLERRELSYDSREHSYVKKIRDLGKQLNETLEGNFSEDMATSIAEKFDGLRGMHREIMENLNVVDTATTEILQDQERDLLRAFRARLFDMQTELDRERTKRDDSAAAWIQRSKQLEAEVDWAKEMADRLERVNQQLSKDNKELRLRFKSGEEDRDYLIKQLVAVKKDNARIQQELERVDFQLQELNEHKKGTSLATMPSRKRSSETDSAGQYDENKTRRLEEIKRLKKILESQQRSLRIARNTYAAELYGRTELQRFLKACLLDIRQHIQAKENPDDALKSTMKLLRGPKADPADEKSLELLRSQDRVVSMLYHKTFPVVPVSSAPTFDDIEDAEVNEDAIRQLLANRPHTSSELPSVRDDDGALEATRSPQETQNRPSTTVH